jgi:hypothetical protein
MDDNDDKVIPVKRITGSGTLAGLLDVIGNELMTGVGIRFATGDYDVVNRICALADRMGGNVEINYGSGFELEGVQVLPAPEPSTAQH